MNRWFVLLLLFGSTELMAQRDSLWKALSGMKDDTTKVVKLLDLGMEYELSEPDSAIVIYEMARDLSKKLDYEMGYCMYANAVAYPLEIFNRLDEKDSILFIAIEICNKHGFRRELAKKYHSLGVSSQFRRDYTTAIDWYLKGLTIVDELKDTALYTAFYNNMGSVFKGLDQNDKAYIYIEKALDIHRARGSESGIASALTNLAILDVRLLQYDKAMARYNEAMEIFRKKNDLEGIFICHLNKTDIFIGQKLFEEALKEVNQGDSIAQLLNADRYKIMSLQAKGSTLKLLKRYPESLDALNKAEIFARATDEKGRLGSILLDKAEVNEKLGNYKQALSDLRMSYAYADSVANENITMDVNELEAKYQSEKKGRELLLKDLELEKQKSSNSFKGFLLIVALLIILLLGIYFMFRQRLNRQEKRANEAQQRLEIASMRERERSRIASDMHDDLGSGLTTIRLLSEVALRKVESHTEQTELKKIADRSTELVQRMSEIVWAMNPANDTLQSLVIYIRAYAAQLLDENELRLVFETNVQDDKVILSGEMRRDLFLITKEALNNALKYADATAITIKVFFETGEVKLEITDNGKGFSQDEIRVGSLGLTSMKKRVESLKGTFSMDSSHGTSIHVTVELS
jgi:signal transduction histidine kinase